MGRVGEGRGVGQHKLKGWGNISNPKGRGEEIGLGGHQHGERGGNKVGRTSATLWGGREGERAVTCLASGILWIH